VPFVRELEEQFHRAHERRYGYADRRRATEIVTLRVRAVVETDVGSIAPVEGRADSGPAREHLMVFDGKTREAVRLSRDAIEPDTRLRGPALLTEYSSTTVVPPGWFAALDRRGNLLLERDQ
jgi:N-methylhydantoinase A